MPVRPRPSSRAAPSNGTPYTSGTGTAILELPSIDASGAIIAAAYDYIVLGQNPANASQFFFDIDSATGSARLRGKFVKGYWSIRHFPL